MININDYSNLKFIFLLLAVLILLLIARNFLIRRIYKQELEIANENMYWKWRNTRGLFRSSK